MAENLNFEYKIKNATTGEEKTYGSFCNTDDCKVFGRYYTWAAVMDSAAVFSVNGKECGYKRKCWPKHPARGACPEGFHVPNMDEWGVLHYNVMGSTSYVAQAKGFDIWPNATDDFGFSALPAGIFMYNYKDNVADWRFFITEKGTTYFWSATEFGTGDASARYMDVDSIVSSRGSKRMYAYTVRCLKD